MADIAGTYEYWTNTATRHMIYIQISYTAVRVNTTTAYVDFTITLPTNNTEQFDYDIRCEPTYNGAVQSYAQIKTQFPMTWSSPIVTYLPRYQFTTTAAATSLNVSFRFYNYTSGSWGSGTYSGTISFPPGYTNPVRGSVSVTPSIFETASISWSGFQHGTSNNITSYEVYYQESSNGSSWGSAVRATTISSSSTSGSYNWSGGTRGYYYRFNVVAIGTYSGTTSDAGTYTGSIRKNRIPDPPSNLRCSNPDTSKLYIPETTAVLLWDAATDPDGQAVSYEVQTLKRNAVNSGWDNDMLYTASTTSLSVDISSKPRGKTLAFGDTTESLSFMVRSKDSLGVYSAWVSVPSSYARNPTVMHGGKGGALVSGIAFVCVNGQWVKAEVNIGVGGVWKPALDRDY